MVYDATLVLRKRRKAPKTKTGCRTCKYVIESNLNHDLLPAREEEKGTLTSCQSQRSPH